MKILIDIGHPAHIHYFKNATKILQRQGYEFLYVVRERDSTIELIETTGFKYVSRGTGGKGAINKIFMIPIIDYRLWKIAKKFKPDLFLSFSSLYAAHVSRIMGKPHIAFDDTEHAKYSHLLCRPFTDVTLTTSCYYAPLTKDQIMFDGYMELCHLHPNHFKSNPEIRAVLGLKEDERYCVLRFISWDANHDIGQHGFSLDDKRKIVQELEKKCKVFISSETSLSPDLLKYRLNIHPAQLHDVLAEASLYIGEGSTTASEAAVLGTPAIYCNSLRVGLMDDEEKFGLVYQVMGADKIIKKANELLSTPENEFKKRQKIMLSHKIDVTAFMVWFIQNYPESLTIMRKNPDIQRDFKYINS